VKRKKDLINYCCDKAIQNVEEPGVDAKLDLKKRLKVLSIGQLEIITAKIMGFSNSEIACKCKLSDSAITRKLQKIKKILKI
jgi:hypothetical protein